MKHPHIHDIASMKVEDFTLGYFGIVIANQRSREADTPSPFRRQRSPVLRTRTRQLPRVC